MARSLDGLFISGPRSEEHTSELQSLRHLVCRLLLEKKTRESAEQAGIEIRYYNIIYNLVDDGKQGISGLRATPIRENTRCGAQMLEIVKAYTVGNA